MNLSPLPCPFCGAEPKFWENSSDVFYLDCSNQSCLIQPRLQDSAKTRESAIKAWNTRKGVNNA